MVSRTEIEAAKADFEDLKIRFAYSWVTWGNLQKDRELYAQIANVAVGAPLGQVRAYLEHQLEEKRAESHALKIELDEAEAKLSELQQEYELEKGDKT
ncbi:hypothetical protein NS383_18960 [Pseudomonas oryzihabitans]|nr:hypothetical protein NS383_18960 [Pseudomonas psychrotolerans]